jgi:hypothetical protein
MMDMEKLFEFLLAIMEANKEDLLAKIDGRLEKMDNSHMEMVSAFKPEIEEETMACQETTEARLEEEKPTSVDRKPEAAEEEVPVEDAIVKPVKGRKKRYRGKKLQSDAMSQRN